MRRTALKRADLQAECQEADVAAILGHEHGAETFGTYGIKIKYPGLKL